MSNISARKGSDWCLELALAAAAIDFEQDAHAVALIRRKRHYDGDSWNIPPIARNTRK